ncbi:MAG: hypothetical protein V1672_02060 [Candidatus Diapherotrites archaeon]
MRMLKKVLVLFLVLICTNSAYAAVHILNPVDVVVPDDGEVSLGSVAVGEIAELIIDKKLESITYFDRAEITQTLPKGWAHIPLLEDRTIILQLNIPKNASENTYSFPLKVWNSKEPENAETINLVLYVKKNLLTADVIELIKETDIENSANYNFILINDSIAEHKVRISTSLPSYWFPTKELTLKPKQTLELPLQLTPKTYGVRDFKINVESLQNNTEYEFDARIIAKSTISSKLKTPLYGLAFFTPSLVPQLLLNAFITLVSA